MTDAFVARFSPWRRVAGLALAAGFVALGLWEAGALGTAGPIAPRWIGYLCASVFATFFVVGVARTAWRGPAVRVDAAGVWLWRPGGGVAIPWNAIRAIGEQEVNGQHFLCLRLDDPARYRAPGWLGRANQHMGFGDVSLGTQATDRWFGDLAAAVGRFAPPILLAQSTDG